jgi:hypothetical protein
VGDKVSLASSVGSVVGVSSSSLQLLTSAAPKSITTAVLSMAAVLIKDLVFVFILFWF